MNGLWKFLFVPAAATMVCMVVMLLFALTSVTRIYCNKQYLHKLGYEKYL